MSPRKRNMLEAFRTAADPGAPRKDLPASRPAPKSPPPPKAPPPPRRARSLPALPSWLPWVALIGIAFVVGITIGLGRRGVQASAEPREESSRAPAPGGAPAGPKESPRRTPERELPAQTLAPPYPRSPGGTESALYDARNQYSVVVATYASTAETLAWATYDHLREEGLPVFTPLEVGSKIVVLAGAAPRSDDLAKLEQTLQGLSRDGRPHAYGDAYRSRIDSLIQRP